MTISYPLTLPSTRFPARVRMRALSVVGASESPFTLEQEIQAHQGQRWEADIELPPISDQDVAEAWLAFLLSLNGREGTFLMGDPAQLTYRGIGGGSPLVNGAGQTGRTLAIDGCPLSTTGWLKAGDVIQLGTGSTSRLHKVLAQANTNGAGQVTLDIWPRLRYSPADNAPVTISGCVGLWRLASNDTGWDVGFARTYGLSFAAVEAL